MIWKYKIDLEDKEIFGKIEKERSITIPDSLKQLIIEGNAATPDKYRFKVGSTERVLGSILSFNLNEQDTDTVFTALESIEDTNLLPFAIDPFGNYICIELKEDIVVFWDHESMKIHSTQMNLHDFFDELY